MKKTKDYTGQTPLDVPAHKTKWRVVIANMAGEIRLVKKFPDIFLAGQWASENCAEVGEFAELIPPADLTPAK